MDVRTYYYASGVGLGAALFGSALLDQAGEVTISNQLRGGALFMHDLFDSNYRQHWKDNNKLIKLILQSH